MENKLILIRLLKAGHVSEEEFMSLYEAIIGLDSQLPTEPRYPDIWQEPYPLIWHGTNHPTTGELLGPTYSVTP